MTDGDFTPGEDRPIIVAYSGVHQAFQIALAAEEAGLSWFSVKWNPERAA